MFTREPFKRFFRHCKWSTVDVLIIENKVSAFSAAGGASNISAFARLRFPTVPFYISCSPSCLLDHIENRNHLGVKPYEKVTDSLLKHVSCCSLAHLTLKGNHKSLPINMQILPAGLLDLQSDGA